MGKHTATIRGGYDKKFYQTPIYRSWLNMKTRCTNRRNNNFAGYGARGITICDKWLSFAGFLEDMLPTHQNGLSIERINNNEGYNKENCKWATQKEQANNTRNTERAERYQFDGQTLTVAEWAKKIGIKRTTLDMRLRHYKWPVAMALSK